ncbi:hypothetical protein [Solitalea koreensis]|uniref:PhoU domain-containing protein n=1 Tax=Solitalea koreensis TaxID=543615 RepID=A0A521C2P2_9SPHI|nr:hypothetical protein [Solitalea koreensis]SMO53605.1 hypothetical protein SAMN06265350_103144 [Solitalea koreensis]
MSLLNKLSDFILPKELDFFGSLHEQSVITQRVIIMLYGIYIEKSETSEQLEVIIEKANDERVKKMKELNEVMITPVDKEAISRIYLQLDWIVLSIKHLNVEIAAYNISSLTEYGKIFLLLQKQIEKMNDCFLMLKQKKYEEVMMSANEIILLDDELIKEYSTQLANLFTSDSIKHIFRHKEILTQLKEISKRIHVSVNSIEDIVFKLN